MDSTQYEYLRVNKYLLSATGTWPYQTIVPKIIFGIVFLLTAGAQAFLQIGGMIAAAVDGDSEAVLESFAPVTISLMCSSKYINFFFNYNQMKRMLDVMRDDWHIYKKVETEYEVLCAQYAIGKTLTVGLTADGLGLFNMTDRPLAFRVEHFVDVDKYYYVLLVHSYCGTIVFTTVVIGIDAMIAVYVMHECGLCEILRVKLENFVEGDGLEVELYPGKYEDRWYRNARECVILHKHIIEFGKMLEGANTKSYLVQLGLNMICVSFTQFQAAINLEQDFAMVLRYVSVTISLLFDLLFLSWPGQQLSDYTERILQNTMNAKWHLSSISCRKLLLIMMLRSMTPLKLTAYTMYTMNLESFSTVARTSFSYTMVLMSMQ
ncbi:odorant receptor 13a-like isoform X2 [Ceratina calcarata]|uniref:Odorant receptor n=1 Tax=Ceratina calcarata TaxID=156304 RepID=A0AAJ7S2G2_9HYME|nr:odorant receptor 13a-like isoform X2 [Ceratina calcarata]